MEGQDVLLLNVMIIDDDEISNFIYHKVILNNGLSKRIIDFQQARNALDYLSQNVENEDELPDLIFLDINMPVINGCDFLDEFEEKIIPKLKKEIVICMLSSSVYKEDIEKAKAYKYVNEYISKPLTSEHINTIVKNHFN